VGEARGTLACSALRAKPRPAFLQAFEQGGKLGGGMAGKIDTNFGGPPGRIGRMHVGVVMVELGGERVPKADVWSFGKHAGGVRYSGYQEIGASCSCLADVLQNAGIGKNVIPDGAKCRIGLAIEVEHKMHNGSAVHRGLLAIGQSSDAVRVLGRVVIRGKSNAERGRPDFRVRLLCCNRKAGSRFRL